MCIDQRKFCTISTCIGMSEFQWIKQKNKLENLSSNISKIDDLIYENAM